MTPRLFDFAIGLCAPDALAVARFAGSEWISRPFRFSVVFAADPAVLGPLDELLGAAARLTIRDGVGEARRIQGVVSRIALRSVEPATGLCFYEVTLTPRIGLAKVRRNSRVFQDLSVPAIAATLFGEHGVQVEARLHGSYAPRTYCVQYQETDFDFVARLLAEDGIFYWFEDPPPESGLEDDARLVLADAPAAYADIEGDTVLRYVGEAGLRGASPAVERLVSRSILVPNQAEVRAFDFLRPELALRHHVAERATARRVRGVPLEVYDYRYDIEEAELPPARAGALLGALRARRDRVAGTSHHRRLAPGHTFEVADHPAPALCGRFVVEQVKHKGEAPEVGAGRAAAAAGHGPAAVYENSFQCLPAVVPARPRPPRRRLQQVLETATVVGPPGEEIHTDEHGRIKVQFHWDRLGKKDDKSSCWVRVAQTWAGSGWGTQFIPRVGMEVLVGFSGGDTDRPVVLSCLYNRTHPLPFPLPAEKTKSGLRTASTPGASGSNELRFEDASGAEQIYVHAQRDLDEVVERNHTRVVGGDEHVAIGGTRETEIAQNHVRTVQGDEIATIHRNAIQHIAGSQHVKIAGGPGAGEAVARALKEFEVAATATPPPTAAPLPPAEREGLEDVLTYRLARLPIGAQLKGDDLERSTRELATKLLSLRTDVAGLSALADRLETFATDMPAAYANLPAVIQIAMRTQTLGAAADKLRTELTSAIAAIEVDETVAPALGTAYGAAKAVLESLAEETTSLQRTTFSRAARVFEAYELPVPEALKGWRQEGKPVERVERAFSGGGPIKPPTWQGKAMEFSAPPDAAGVRKRIQLPSPPSGAPPSGAGTEQGLSLDVSPGAEINAQFGIRLAAGGSVIELSPAGVTIFASTINLCAATVNITACALNIAAVTLDARAASVRIDGGATTIIGAPIKLNL